MRIKTNETITFESGAKVEFSSEDIVKETKHILEALTSAAMISKRARIVYALVAECQKCSEGCGCCPLGTDFTSCPLHHSADQESCSPTIAEWQMFLSGVHEGRKLT